MENHDKKVNIEFLNQMPNSEASVHRWDLISPETKAVLVETYGSGSVPGEFVPKIHDLVRKGVPVFLLNGVENTANEASGEKSIGIPEINYEVQQNALDAGAVHIESVNIGHLKRSWTNKSNRPKDNVIEILKQLARESNDMFDYIDRVREKYNLTDEEIKFVEEATRVEKESKPVTQEAILRSREALGLMLEALKIEMSEHEGELKAEIRPRRKLK